jgi:signal peptidase I
MKNLLKNPKVYFVVDLLLNIVFVVVLALFIRHFIVSPFHVYGPSMCNTINNIKGECVNDYGDYIIVNEFVYKDFFGWSFSQPRAGDVVVFRPPTDTSQYYVKRIIGQPGDKIKIENGFVYKEFNRTFELLDESSYLNEDNLGKTYTQVGVDPIEFQIPAGHYFVMGDNRNRSTDSRQCFTGGFGVRCDTDNMNAFVPQENIRGKAWIVFYPFENLQVLKSVEYDF